MNVADALRLRLQVLHAIGEVAFKHLFTHLAYDRNADVVQEIKACRVCEKSVPKTYAIGHIELLAQEEHEPAQGVELGVNLLLLQLLVDVFVHEA